MVPTQLNPPGSQQQSQYLVIDRSILEAAKICSEAIGRISIISLLCLQIVWSFFSFWHHRTISDRLSPLLYTFQSILLNPKTQLSSRRFGDLTWVFSFLEWKKNTDALIIILLLLVLPPSTQLLTHIFRLSYFLLQASPAPIMQCLHTTQIPKHVLPNSQISR